jgi:8-oxo-dGTP pyrophosphatase MutT (NUDIX family)
MPDDPYRRRSARVLLLDGADRLLLFRFHFNRGEPDSGRRWLTPGGGVDEQESLPQAAVRELREETGLVVGPEELGPLVATTSGYADLGWAAGVFRDDFFVHRVSAHKVDVSGLEAREQTQITGHRWWTAEELSSTTEIVHPFGLAALMADLLAGRIPEEPVRLPWHH